MANLLYIIGAGASAQVLPIINDLHQSNGIIRKGLMSELNDFTAKLSVFPELKFYQQLCTEASAFTTPDTFAKFLYITNRDDDYISFKRILTSYFFWKERFEKKPNNCLDKRVLSFLTTLTNNKGYFPSNVKILSWNYDTQFVRAIDSARKTVTNNHFIPNFRIFPFNKDSTVDKMNLTFLSLNGIAGYTYNTETNKQVDKLMESNSKFQYVSSNPEHMTNFDVSVLIKNVFLLFSEKTENTLISYAWEKEFETQRDYYYANDKLEYARALSRASDILVVIGYSFPFFNREIDKEIFKEMTLNKIYFQDPKLDGNFLYSQFNLNKTRISIEHVPDVKNYFIPHELNDILQ